ncbi:hypothetical protein C4D60_Mb01t13520 [Musa balbisiana]|uniref:cysteine--tRNA ligase n=1 Tax=Musa balbisiana TaxID=52838 RepID=A0A4S8JM03_MUSBA|nr:hypothetical protein C4D60_Mb01t13520 [Musa balbisiana]
MGNPELVLFNSMSKQKEVFKTRFEGQVSMYVCGITPYDFSHIGHARAYVAFDVLYRYLKHLGYEVKYVRNFTDIDDKIIKRANESGEDLLSLSRRFSEAFLQDVAELQCLPPTHEPRVSDHIEQIKDMITKIIENGYGYTIEGDVYFSIDNFPAYCQLSGRKLDDNRAGGGGRVSVDLRKRNPGDFALWKAAKPGEPSWESPWGPGRPGWHIECSAMSAQYLGDAFDIHGGGKDLIFPHHENELAQSQAACPEHKVSYWMHNGFVNKDNQKMSKSDDNFFTIRDIIARYHPLALRFFLMRTHYRSDVNYSDRQLETASDRVFYIYQTLYDCEQALSPFRQENIQGQVPADVKELIDKFHSDFLASMSDDLHTAVVLDDLMEPFKAINSNLKKFKGKRQQKPLILTLFSLEKEVKDVLGVLGLLDSSCTEVLQQLKDKALSRAGLIEEQVLQLIEDRNLARENKEYEKSDKIRKELYDKGIALMDEPKGTVWRPSEPPEGILSALPLCDYWGIHRPVSSAPVLRRTLEEGFASSSSVAPNFPVRASGSSDRFGCRQVHCFPARSLVFQSFSEKMQRGRGGRDDFFGFGDPFAGFGGFGRPGSLISSFFGGRDPFDDPFFTQPFGSLMGPSMLGPSMFAGQGSLFGETSNAGFLEQAPPVNKSKGPIIQELSDDDDDDGGEGEKADKEQKENPRKHSRTSKEPFVQDPDEVEEKKSRYMQYRNNYNQSNPMQAQGHSFTFQSSTVTYGGPNGAYYTSSTARRMGGDGVIMEESKEADTTTGRASHRVSRGIREKGHSVTRKLNSDGRVDTVQMLHNLNEDELPVFEETWKGKAKQHLPGWNRGLDLPGNRQEKTRGWALPSTQQPHESGRMRSQPRTNPFKAGGSMK